jgi:hypothetical protein
MMMYTQLYHGGTQHHHDMICVGADVLAGGQMVAFFELLSWICFATAGRNEYYPLPEHPGGWHCLQQQLMMITEMFEGALHACIYRSVVAFFDSQPLAQHK